MIKKYLLITAGLLLVGFATLGIFLPLLPTTPLLLLAGYCFLKSSKKLHRWLITHKVFGKYIDEYLTYKAVRKKVKIVTIIFLWFSLTISFFMVNIFFVRIILIVVGISVTTHILLLKTHKQP